MEERVVTVDVVGLRVAYEGAEALRGVDLHVADGEAVVVAGPSGSGKTTLLRAVAGLAPVTAGDVRFDGHSVVTTQTRDRDVAYVRTGDGLYRHLDVRGNVEFPMRHRGVPEPEIATRRSVTARLLRLGGILDRRPAALSGGERQRVALGRATGRTPRVYLLDEPLANLEPAERRRLAGDLRQQQRGLGVTTLYVTHDQHEMMTSGDRLAVLVDGRVAQVGIPLDVYRAPASISVAQFVGDPPMAVVRGELHAADWSVVVAGRRVPLPPAARSRLDPPPRTVVVGIRAVALGPPRPDRPTWELVVARAWPLGRATLVTGDLDGRPASHVTATLPPASYAPGDRVPVSLDPSGVHLFDGASGAARWPEPTTSDPTP